MPPKSKGTVLITGAAKRVGSVIAAHLAKADYRIALHCNKSLKEAQSLARLIGKDRCGVFMADLKVPQAAENLIPAVLKKFPDLKHLINNASIFEPSTLRDFNANDLDAECAINFRAPMILLSAFSRYIREGSIVNILDTNVRKNKGGHINYILSKKSLAQLTQLAAVELAPQIRVNAIAPGLILPPEGQKTEYLERLAKNIPLKRKGEPKDIAQAALFLLQNTFITGQTIFVDGGEHLT